MDATTAAPYVQLDVSKSLGALLAGTWGNSALYALVLLQSWKFFTRSSQGGLIKVTLAVLLVIDTVCTLGQYAAVWQYLIANWGSVAYLQRQYWPIIVYLITTSLSGAIVQTFLVARVYKLSQSIPLVIGFAVLICTGLGGGLATAFTIILHPTYDERHLLNIPVPLWFGSSAGADVLIAAALIFYLNKVRVQAERFDQSRLKGSLQRLIRIAVETGSATAALALVILSTYLHDPEANIATGLCFSLGRLYTITVLLNVSAARSLTKDDSNDPSISQYGYGSKHLGIGGVSVNHSTTIQVEDGRGDAPIHLDDLNSIAKLTQNQERQQAYSFEDRKRSNNEKSLAFRDDEV